MMTAAENEVCTGCYGSGYDGNREARCHCQPRAQPVVSKMVPIEGQSSSCHQDWVNRAIRVLTAHSDYRNTEHGGPANDARDDIVHFKSNLELPGYEAGGE